MNIEEAKEMLIKLTKDNISLAFQDEIEAIDTVLNELEEQTNANKELNKEVCTYLDMIKEMAEYIAGLDVDEDICKNIEHCADERKLCSECIKEYFYKKIENSAK